MNEYRDTVSQSISELGCTDLTEIRITEKPESKQVSSKAYSANIEDCLHLKI